LLGIDQDDWWVMFNRAPEIAVNLMKILAKRIRLTNEQLQGSSEAEVEDPLEPNSDNAN
jgi:CRP-like cAMP-binding protein